MEQEQKKPGRPMNPRRHLIALIRQKLDRIDDMTVLMRIYTIEADHLDEEKKKTI